MRVNSIIIHWHIQKCIHSRSRSVVTCTFYINTGECANVFRVPPSRFTSPTLHITETNSHSPSFYVHICLTMSSYIEALLHGFPLFPHRFLSLIFNYNLWSSGGESVQFLQKLPIIHNQFPYAASLFSDYFHKIW